MERGTGGKVVLWLWVACMAGLAVVMAMGGAPDGTAAAIGRMVAPSDDAPAGAGRVELWVDLLSGEPVGYPAVLNDLAGAGIIYLGERHDVARHHEWQARIVEGLARRGRPLVLGLEQIEAQYQPAVDRYNRGEIDFDELARQIDWEHRWPGYEVYRPAIEAAHRAGAPVLALNARLETVRQVSRGGGVSHLGPEARADLPAEMVLDDPVYERLLIRQLTVHAGASHGTLRPMIEAQIARDETMAERLAGFLRSEQGKGRQAVVVTGAGHVSYGLGVPDRVRRRMPRIRERIVLFTEGADHPAETADTRPEAASAHEGLRAIGRSLADYLSIAAAD